MLVKIFVVSTLKAWVIRWWGLNRKLCEFHPCRCPWEMCWKYCLMNFLLD